MRAAFVAHARRRGLGNLGAERSGSTTMAPRRSRFAGPTCCYVEDPNRRMQSVCQVAPAKLLPAIASLRNWGDVGRGRGIGCQRQSAASEWRRMPTSAGAADQPGLIPANLVTLDYFSVSSAMSLPESAGEPTSTVPPRWASRTLSWGSARPALISLLSLSQAMEVRTRGAAPLKPDKTSGHCSVAGHPGHRRPPSGPTF